MSGICVRPYSAELIHFISFSMHALRNKQVLITGTFLFPVPAVVPSSVHPFEPLVCVFYLERWSNYSPAEIIFKATVHYIYTGPGE